MQAQLLAPHCAYQSCAGSPRAFKEAPSVFAGFLRFLLGNKNYCTTTGLFDSGPPRHIYLAFIHRSTASFPTRRRLPFCTFLHFLLGDEGGLTTALPGLCQSGAMRFSLLALAALA